ncbi:MAG: universal stress protein [Paramuribaculum sp.]
MDDRFITVAIHTFDRAMALKSLLEREGLEVMLQNVNLTNPVIASGVRVRIHESDLPIALRIIENQEIFNGCKSTCDANQPIILVPVDFSDYSERACNMAFRLAAIHNASIVLLYSYVDPVYSNRVQLSDMLTFDSKNSDSDERAFVEEEAQRQMKNFTDRILDRIKAGSIPAVKFSTEIIEGIPEESIVQYAKEHLPILIVMGTRGAGTKERELVGSVTAEVLDTCRFPVFTVPDTVSISSVSDITDIVFFSNFDQEDILAIDALFRILPVEHLNMVLVKIPGKKQSSDSDSDSLSRLGAYCREHYPAHHFAIDTLSISSIEDDFSRITRDMPVKLIAVPNKKKNIFARLFNPGIAHRILFHSDIPMIVIPI